MCLDTDFPVEKQVSVSFNESWWERLGRQAWDLGLLPKLGMVLGPRSAVIDGCDGDRFYVSDQGDRRRLPVDTVLRVYWPDFRFSATLGELESFGRTRLGSGAMAFQVDAQRWTVVSIRRVDQWPTSLLSEAREATCAAQAWIAVLS